MDIIEKPIHRETMFHGKIFDVERMQVEMPDGRISIRDVVRFPGACCILALDSEGMIPFVEQFRAPVGRVTLELPAGKIDRGEDPLDCAKRELSEETGYQSDSWQKLTALLPSPGYTDEVQHTYLATNAQRGKRHLDDGEFVNVRMLSLEEAYQKAMSAEIVDGNTVCAILMAYALLGR